MIKKISKELLRKTALNKRLSYDKGILEVFSKKICRKLTKKKEFASSSKILFYMPIKNEVNILPLIEKSLKTKEVLLPKVYGKTKMKAYKISSLKDLEKGNFGILEPKKNCKMVHSKEIDLVVVPGIAFSKIGQRLGFGKGFYDNFLKKVSCPKIALAYNFQILENIPAENHDQLVDYIITN